MLERSREFADAKSRPINRCRGVSNHYLLHPITRHPPTDLQRATKCGKSAKTGNSSTIIKTPEPVFKEFFAPSLAFKLSK